MWAESVRAALDTEEEQIHSPIICERPDFFLGTRARTYWEITWPGSFSLSRD
jgi:hypothetical protein